MSPVTTLPAMMTEIRIRVADLLDEVHESFRVAVRDVNADILHGARGLAVHALEFLPVIVSDAEQYRKRWPCSSQHP